MPTVTENIENSTIEATKLAQEAARRYMDETTSIGRTYFNSWATAAQAGLRLAFDVQTAMIQASRMMMDATNQANRAWLDQTADTIRKGQEATAKLVATSYDMAETAMPKGRE